MHAQVHSLRVGGLPWHTLFGRQSDNKQIHHFYSIGLIFTNLTYLTWPVPLCQMDILQKVQLHLNKRVGVLVIPPRPWAIMGQTGVGGEAVNQQVTAVRC